MDKAISLKELLGELWIWVWNTWDKFGEYDEAISTCRHFVDNFAKLLTKGNSDLYPDRLMSEDNRATLRAEPLIQVKGKKQKQVVCPLRVQKLWKSHLGIGGN